MSKKIDNANNDASELPEQNIGAGDVPQKIYVLPSCYRLAADGRSMEMLRRLGSTEPEKINGRTALISGSRCEFSVWGLFADGLRLLLNDGVKPEYKVDCLDKTGAALTGAVEIEHKSAPSVRLGNRLRRGVSFSVSACALDARRKTLDVIVRVSSAADSRVCTQAAVTVVRPLKLALLGDEFSVSENGRSLICRRMGRRGQDVGIEDLPVSHILPSSGKRLYLQPVVLCSDGLYRQLERREIEVEFKSGSETEILEDDLCLQAKNNVSGMAVAEARLAVQPEIKTSFTVEVVVPTQIYAYHREPGHNYYIDEESDSIRHWSRNNEEISSGSAEDPLTFGVGEEMRLQVFARYSDGLLRCLDIDGCSWRAEASEDGVNWRECGALRIAYRKILVSRYAEAKQLRLVAVPKGAAADAAASAAAVLYFKVLQPVALYLAPSHYLHIWRRGNWSRVDAGPEAWDRLCRERTVGVDGWCALDFAARYDDGSVRFVDTECLDTPQLAASEDAAKRRPRDTEPCVKFSRYRRLMADGLSHTKQPLEYRVSISGTDVVTDFKISVSKVKALHLVQSGLMRRVMFDDNGQPVDVSGEKLAEDEILDGQTVELLPGQALGVMVLAEYEDGCWGYCRRQTYDLRNTAGVELLDRGFILVTPKKQTPELARVKAASANDRRISAEFFVDVKMPDRLSVYLDEKSSGSGKPAYTEVLPGEVVRMKIGDVVPFSVMAVYGDRMVNLRPSDYTVSTLGAGVRVWSGRSYMSNASRERLEAVFEEEMELDSAEENSSAEENGSTGEEALQNLNTGVRFEAVKRTRENKTVEVTVRLGLKPSVKGTLNITVLA